MFIAYTQIYLLIGANFKKQSRTYSVIVAYRSTTELYPVSKGSKTHTMSMYIVIKPTLLLYVFY